MDCFLLFNIIWPNKKNPLDFTNAYFLTANYYYFIFPSIKLKTLRLFYFTTVLDYTNM